MKHAGKLPALPLSKESIKAIVAAEVERLKEAGASARTCSVENKNRPRHALPSPETLALIAAHVATGENELPVDAVSYAFELWREACLKLEFEAEAQAARDAASTASAHIQRPLTFPASLEDFLRLIVRAKTPADGTKRFRDFIAWRVERSYAERHRGTDEVQRRMEDEVTRLMHKYRTHGVRWEASWLSLTEDYLDWWKSRKGEAARKSASTRNKRR